MKSILVFFSLMLQFIVPAISQNKDQNNTQVKIANGIVQGTIEKSGITSFKGIPFAAPPVGELRWKEPQPGKKWEGVLKVDKFGPNPMQYNIFGDMIFRSNGMSEDCLYLNVWTPSKKSDKLLPVLVYFYGGGFVAGDGSESRYDGESMASKGIVALTVNYRLGVFGFLSHPELTKESPHRSSGNYAVMDQAAALKWVQQNIAAFGGDPKRVTIAGESAGSIAVSAQMVSPVSKDLFAGAIGESGSLLGALPPVPLRDAEQTGLEFARSVNAASLKELRAMAAEQLIEASRKFNPFRFSMTIDGYFFPGSPYEIYEKGEQARVPLLVGWNSEEMSYRAIMGNEKLTKENFEKVVQQLYGDRSSEVLKVYHANTDEEVEQVATDLAGDRFISFSTWKWAELHSKTSGRPVYRYLFSKPRPVSTDTSNKAPAAKGAVHAAEIEYVMGNLASNKVFAWTTEDYKVSQVAQEYFANFIKTGNPNGTGLPNWPAATHGNTVQVMRLDVNPIVEPEKHRERYLFLDLLQKK
jgi:para-nitrobenzyl esterase